MNVALKLSELALRLNEENKLLKAVKNKELSVKGSGYLEPDLQNIILEGAKVRVEKRIEETKRLILEATNTLT